MQEFLLGEFFGIEIWFPGWVGEAGGSCEDLGHQIIVMRWAVGRVVGCWDCVLVLKLLELGSRLMFEIGRE